MGHGGAGAFLHGSDGARAVTSRTSANVQAGIAPLGLDFTSREPRGNCHARQLQENRLRHFADRRGLQLHKLRDGRGLLVDLIETKTLVFGDSQSMTGYDLHQVEDELPR